MDLQEQRSSRESSLEIEDAEKQLRLLERDRRINDQKLRNRFDRIFAKYEHDFTGVGDEIDIESGEIVVNNGHLEHMHDENDPGNSASFQIVNDVEDSLDHEVDNAFSDNEESSENSVDDSEEDELDEYDTLNGPSGQVPIEDGSLRGTAVGSLGGISRPAPRLAHLLVGQNVEDPIDLTEAAHSSENDLVADRSDSGLESPSDMLEQLPALRKSILDMKSRSKHGRSVDENTIRALGMSIANQLAALVSKSSKNSTSDLKIKSESPNMTFADPLRAKRVKRRRSSGEMPPVASASPSKRSLWAPMKHPKARKRRRPTVPEPAELIVDQDHPGEDIDGSAAAFGARPAVLIRSCFNCSTTRSDYWRSGPNDEQLCNSCGMYFYRYGLMKPLRSPSISTDDRGSDYESTQSQVTDEDEIDGVDIREVANLIYPANTSRRLRAAFGKAKGTRFTNEEDALIIRLKEKDQLSWEAISRYFVGRSAYGLQCRYSKKLRTRSNTEQEVDSLLSYNFEEPFGTEYDDDGSLRKDVSWPNNEDELLLELREDQELEWGEIAVRLPGHTLEDIKKRYVLLLHASMREYEIKSKPKVSGVEIDGEEGLTETRMYSRFTAEEDALIVRLREVEKLEWATLAASLPGRTSYSIQKRYVRELAPGKLKRREPADSKLAQEPTIEERMLAIDPDLANRVLPEKQSKKRYEPQEDELILRLRGDGELSWEEIAEQMPGRQPNSVKNRYLYLYLKDFDGQHSSHITMSVDPQAPRSTIAQTNGNLMNSRSDAQASGFDSNPLEQSLNSRAKDASATEHLSPTGPPEALDSGVPFDNAEDDIILQLKEMQGYTWTAIAGRLPGRTAGSIASRYSSFLRPSPSIQPPSAINTQHENMEPLSMAKPLQMDALKSLKASNAKRQAKTNMHPKIIKFRLSSTALPSGMSPQGSKPGGSREVVPCDPATSSSECSAKDPTSTISICDHPTSLSSAFHESPDVVAARQESESEDQGFNSRETEPPDLTLGSLSRSETLFHKGLNSSPLSHPDTLPSTFQDHQETRHSLGFKSDQPTALQKDDSEHPSQQLQKELRSSANTPMIDLVPKGGSSTRFQGDFPTSYVPKFELVTSTTSQEAVGPVSEPSHTSSANEISYRAKLISSASEELSHRTVWPSSYATPARYNHSTHPYFIAPVAPTFMPSGHERETKSSPFNRHDYNGTKTATDLRVSNSAIISNTLEPSQNSTSSVKASVLQPKKRGRPSKNKFKLNETSESVATASNGNFASRKKRDAQNDNMTQVHVIDDNEGTEDVSVDYDEFTQEKRDEKTSSTRSQEEGKRSRNFTVRSKRYSETSDVFRDTQGSPAAKLVQRELTLSRRISPPSFSHTSSKKALASHSKPGSSATKHTVPAKDRRASNSPGVAASTRTAQLKKARFRSGQPSSPIIHRPSPRLSVDGEAIKRVVETPLKVAKDDFEDELA